MLRESLIRVNIIVNKEDPLYIKRVIELKGGNKYKEGVRGRKKNPDRVY